MKVERPQTLALIPILDLGLVLALEELVQLAAVRVEGPAQVEGPVQEELAQGQLAVEQVVGPARAPYLMLAQEALAPEMVEGPAPVVRLVLGKEELELVAALLGVVVLMQMLRAAPQIPTRHKTKRCSNPEVQLAQY